MTFRKSYSVVVTVLAVCSLQSGSPAVLTTDSGLRERLDVECGSNISMICTTKPNPNEVVWRIDSLWAADCTFGFCSENTSIPSNYIFSHNTTEGVFTLNIQNVSFEQNRKIFSCTEDSVSSDTVTVDVNVLPDSTCVFETTSDTHLAVTTGCVYPVSNITFEWYIYKADMEAVRYTKQEPVETLNYSGCSSRGCGHTEASRISSTLNIPSVKTGELYLFKVIVRHTATHETVVINSTKTYRINDGGIHCSIDCDIVCRLLIVIGVFFFIDVIVGCLLLYVMWISYPTKKDHCKEDEWCTLYIEILLHTVSAILWIVIVSLFIWSLCHCCSCDDPSCICCEIVLILRYVLLTLLGIHVVLWLILLCVLYGQKGKGYDESDKDCKTKLKVRFIFSTIPVVGLFPVCGWLIWICCRENSDTEDTELSSKKPKRELPPAPFKSPTKPITEKTGEPISRSTKKGQKKLDMFVKQNFGSNQIEDQVSTSEITVQPKGIDTVGARSQPLDANATGKGKASTKTESGGKTNKQRDQKNSTLSKSAAVQSTQNNRNEKTSSQKHVTGDENKSKKEGHENKSPKTTNKVSIEAQTGNNRVTKNGSDHKLSNSNENPPGSLKSDKSLPTKAKSRKKTDENKPPNNTISLGAKTQNGNKHVSETWSGDTLDSSDNDSLPNFMKSDNTLPERRKSEKEKGEKGPQSNTESVSAKSHNGDKHVSETWSGDTQDSSDNDGLPNSSKSDNTLPERRKSGTEKGEKGPQSNTESASAKAHNGSETITRTISAIFHDEEDVTTTVSIDSETKM